MSTNIDSIDPNLKSHHYYEPFTATIAGFIVPMLTGLLSACSSGLIIYIIFRSQQKLSTTYHRIMTFMSLFDIISSLFIALGTVMVPSDNVYKFAGPMLGNKFTCQVQGWFILFSIAGANALNVCLSWYFVCKLAFQIGTQTISKYIEPIMYAYTVGLACFISSFYLVKDLIHSNAYDSFCVFVPYPESCDEDKWYDWNYCTWKDGDIEKYFKYANVAYIMILVHFVLIVIGMSIILWTLHREKQEMRDLIQRDDQQMSTAEGNETEENSKEIAMSELRHSNVLILQALMYIGAFFLTWVLNVLSGELNIASMETDAINSVLFPLQGLWNLLIFLYDKSYLIRQVSSDNLGFWQAVKKIVTAPAVIPVFSLTNIEITVRDEPETLSQEPYDIDHKMNSAYEEASNARIALSVSGPFAGPSSVDVSLTNISQVAGTGHPPTWNLPSDRNTVYYNSNNK
jgi:hypothetical protein